MSLVIKKVSKIIVFTDYLSSEKGYSWRVKETYIFNVCNTGKKRKKYLTCSAKENIYTQKTLVLQI